MQALTDTKESLFWIFEKLKNAVGTVVSITIGPIYTAVVDAIYKISTIVTHFFANEGARYLPLLNAIGGVLLIISLGGCIVVVGRPGTTVIIGVVLAAGALFTETITVRGVGSAIWTVAVTIGDNPLVACAIIAAGLLMGPVLLEKSIMFIIFKIVPFLFRIVLVVPLRWAGRRLWERRVSELLEPLRPTSGERFFLNY